MRTVRHLKRLLLALLLAGASAGLAAAEPGEPASGKLTVAVAECPPFVMVDGDRYSGLAIFLWERVAGELGLEWEYTAQPLSRLLESVGGTGLEPGVDAGISCVSITVERETKIDFTHSFTETHTAIAVREPTLGSAIRGFFTNPLVIRIGLIVLGVAAAIGIVFYLLEHRINKKLYSSGTTLGKSVEAMIIGLMFATNGPLRFYRFKTLTGRILATLLTLAGTVAIAAGTAVLASTFTINSLQSQVRGVDDLRDLRVGALESSTSSAFLDANGIGHQTRDDLDSLIDALDRRQLDAVVSDATFLNYRIREGKAQGQYESLTVLPLELEAQNYAFVLEQNSRYREDVNRALLTERKRREWRDRVRRYLGH